MFTLCNYNPSIPRLACRRGRIQGGGDINSALGLLPDKLRTELALHVNLSTLKKVNYTRLRRQQSSPHIYILNGGLQVSIFKECQPEFLHDLVLKMKAYIFTPGDLICRKGEVAREMFIIADGILEVIRYKHNRDQRNIHFIASIFIVKLEKF